MPAAPLEKRFAALCEIVRAQHFAWREAVRETCPGVDASAVVMRMWERTGEQTAAAYLRRIDRALPLAPQVAAAIAHSSQCMGEDAVAEPGAGADEAFVRHRACPWLGWHERAGLLAEDRPACDRWFRSTLDALGRALGVHISCETTSSLPEGGDACVRRLRVTARETPSA
jgi:hypothetical protein